MKRRQVLKSMVALSALGMNACSGMKFHIAGDGSIQHIELPQHFDEIDHFDVTHALRDGKTFAIPAPSMHKDIVIIGGGISGLTAMHYLTDFDTLLLEKEDAVGGNSRRRQQNGLHYPLGAILSQGPIEPFTDFFTELDIPFQRLPEHHLDYRVNGKTIADPMHGGWQDLPLDPADQLAFKNLSEELSIYADPEQGIFFPRTENRDEIKRLDKLTFKQFLAGKSYTEASKKFMQLVLSSRLGENGDQVSAWIALYILSTLKQPAYTLPGGHGAIAERLREKCLSQPTKQIQTGFTVINIENKTDDEVWITGVNQDGELQTISAACAIMAGPKVYAKHAVRGLAQARPELYNRFNYNAYLVAQVALDHPVTSTFETVSADHFSRFIVAPDTVAGNTHQHGGSHLTVYVPYPSVGGRIALYTADCQQIAETIIKDVHDILPQTRQAINSITLHRWGHPMVSCAPGMDQLCDQAKQPFGRVAFAHSDSFGISGLYSAVWAGMEASMDAQILMTENSF